MAQVSLKFDTHELTYLIERVGIPDIDDPTGCILRLQLLRARQVSEEMEQPLREFRCEACDALIHYRGWCTRCYQEQGAMDAEGWAR